MLLSHQTRLSATGPEAPLSNEIATQQHLSYEVSPQPPTAAGSQCDHEALLKDYQARVDAVWASLNDPPATEIENPWGPEPHLPGHDTELQLGHALQTNEIPNLGEPIPPLNDGYFALLMSPLGQDPDAAESCTGLSNASGHNHVVGGNAFSFQLSVAPAESHDLLSLAYLSDLDSAFAWFNQATQNRGPSTASSSTSNVDTRPGHTSGSPLLGHDRRIPQTEEASPSRAEQRSAEKASQARSHQRCPFCEKRVAAQLRRHIDRACPKNPDKVESISCACGMPFTRLDNLRRHQKKKCKLRPGARAGG